MKPFRVRRMRVQEHLYDVYDVIELYKAKVITKDEARYLVYRITKVFFPLEQND